MLHDESDATFKEAFQALLKAWAFIAGGAVLGLVAVLIFLHFAVPQYRAEMLIGPTAQTSGVDLTSMLGQFDLPNLQYIVRRPGTSESADFTRFEHILRGASVAGVLVKNPYVRRNAAFDAPFRFLGNNDVDTPAELAAYLEDNVSVEPVGQTHLRRVSYMHADPEFAVFLLRAMQKAADDIIRADVRAQTGKRIAYLTTQLDEVLHPQHKDALVSMLMEQEHLRMMVNMDEPYAASLAEAPSVSAKPHWPNKSIFIPAFILVGAFAGYVLSGLFRKP